MISHLRTVAYRTFTTVLTLWLVGTAAVIVTVFASVMRDGMSGDPSIIFRSH